MLYFSIKYLNFHDLSHIQTTLEKGFSVNGLVVRKFLNWKKIFLQLFLDLVQTYRILQNSQFVNNFFSCMRQIFELGYFF